MILPYGLFQNPIIKIFNMFKLNSELLSVLNHCNTSWVKDLVNWHSEKVWSIESRSPQYIQLLSHSILNLKSSFLVTTILWMNLKWNSITLFSLQPKTRGYLNRCDTGFGDSFPKQHFSSNIGPAPLRPHVSRYSPPGHSTAGMFVTVPVVAGC